MKSIILKSILVLSILSFIVLGILRAPKGNHYIEYERNMLESNQMNISDSQYFKISNGVLKLK